MAQLSRPLHNCRLALEFSVSGHALLSCVTQKNSPPGSSGRLLYAGLVCVKPEKPELPLGSGLLGLLADDAE